MQRAGVRTQSPATRVEPDGTQLEMLSPGQVGWENKQTLSGLGQGAVSPPACGISICAVCCCPELRTCRGVAEPLTPQHMQCSMESWPAGAGPTVTGTCDCHCTNSQQEERDDPRGRRQRLLFRGKSWGHVRLKPPGLGIGWLAFCLGWAFQGNWARSHA